MHSERQHLQLVGDLKELAGVPLEAELEHAKMALYRPQLPNMTVSPEFAQLLAPSTLFARLVIPLNPDITVNALSGRIIDRHLAGRRPVTVPFNSLGYIETTYQVGDTARTTRERARMFADAVATLFNVSDQGELIVEMHQKVDQTTK